VKFQSVALFLTDMSISELCQHQAFQQYSESTSVLELSDDWQFEFSRRVGLDEHSIPWNLLRATHFKLPKNTKTIVCCDPVMMQMTHRGAYLWGQQGIDFSQEHVMQIIASINEKLMEEGECFYLLNNQQWLYTSEQELELNVPSFENYIGKDMFGFSYPGKDGSKWDRLATEIQMLIKQMMDYQGLPAVSAEHLINIHFWGNTKARLISKQPNLQQSSHVIMTNDSQLEALCQYYKIRHLLMDKISDLDEIDSTETNQLSVVVSKRHRLEVGQLFESVVDLVNKNQLKELLIVAADKQIIIKEKESVVTKILKFLGL
jgi:hypothetical protein